MPAHSPEEIHTLIETAVNAGDLDAFIELHEENATTVVPPDGRAVTGRGEIRDALAPILSSRPRVEIECVAKLEGDGFALTHARVHLVGTHTGEQFDVHGHGTVVSRQQPDGSWRILLDNPMGPA